MKRVVVTGIGAVTPLGNTFTESWEAVKKGISGIAPITKFDISDIEWKKAGEVSFSPEKYLSDKEIRRIDPFIQYALAAAEMAVGDALPGRKDLNRGSVVIGSSRGGITNIEAGMKKPNAYLMSGTTISMAASKIAQKLGIKGHALGISNACASGANAIGEAYRLIKNGYSKTAIAGGSEAPITRLCLMGYGISGALSSENIPRPFDRLRDGFVISEGACIFVLEEYGFALKRGAKIYGEIIGYGNTNDAFHETKPDPEGEAEAIKKALKDARIYIDEIGHINAHGTATPLGDKAETEAIKRAFGKRAYKIPITSIKSMTGHMLGASGAFEAAVTIMSIFEGIIPPTINLKHKDPDCDLNYATKTMKKKLDVALSNSFGFGGVNAVLVLRGLTSLCRIRRISG